MRGQVGGPLAGCMRGQAGGRAGGRTDGRVRRQRPLAGARAKVGPSATGTRLHKVDPLPQGLVPHCQRAGSDVWRRWVEWGGGGGVCPHALILQRPPLRPQCHTPTHPPSSHPATHPPTRPPAHPPPLPPTRVPPNELGCRGHGDVSPQLQRAHVERCEDRVVHAHQRPRGVGHLGRGVGGAQGAAVGGWVVGRVGVAAWGLGGEWMGGWVGDVA